MLGLKGQQHPPGPACTEHPPTFSNGGVRPSYFITYGPRGGAALTSEGLLVELYKVGEDVFGHGLLVGQTLQQDDHLRLAHGMHALRCHVPALPVHVCGKKETRNAKAHCNGARRCKKNCWSTPSDDTQLNQGIYFNRVSYFLLNCTCRVCRSQL